MARLDLIAIAMGVSFAVIWSSAFTSARVIVADAPPLYALSLRFFISGVIGIALAVALGQSWRLTPKQWQAAVLFGVFQFGLYLGTNFVAMQWVEASFAAIIASTLPLFVGLAGVLFLNEKLPVTGLLGLLLGFLGVFVIMGARLSAGVDLFGAFLCLIGVLSLSVATLAVRTAASGGNLLMVVGIQMVIGALALLPFAMALEVPVFTPSWPLLFAFGYTVIFPGLLATFVWFLLVKRIGALKASAFHFLNPFFGVAIAWLLLGEPLGALDIVGVAVIMAGIFMVQSARQQS